MSIVTYARFCVSKRVLLMFPCALAQAVRKWMAAFAAFPPLGLLPIGERCLGGNDPQKPRAPAAGNAEAEKHVIRQGAGFTGRLRNPAGCRIYGKTLEHASAAG